MRATFRVGGIVDNCLYQFHGFPGTMGASFIDYITTDMTTSTPEMAEQFDEYYLALPYSYMMSDHRLERSKLCSPMIFLRVTVATEQELAQRGSRRSCRCRHHAAEVIPTPSKTLFLMLRLIDVGCAATAFRKKMSLCVASISTTR
jgi:hypothetical protein